MNFKKSALLASLLTTALVSSSAYAGVYADSLGKCLVSSSTNTDKQQLVEWIFSAISLNPAISPYTNIPSEKRGEIDENMAALFEKLVGESCKTEAADALKYEGASAFNSAFQLLGQVAGQQIFASPEVAKGAESFYSKIDFSGLQKKLGIVPSKP